MVSEEHPDRQEEGQELVPVDSQDIVPVEVGEPTAPQGISEEEREELGKRAVELVRELSDAEGRSGSPDRMSRMLRPSCSRASGCIASSGLSLVELASSIARSTSINDACCATGSTARVGCSAKDAHPKTRSALNATVRSCRMKAPRWCE